MANPRVFVSSTCYDLAEERDTLIDFCHSYGFDIALSERGDIFYHPELHTHECCTQEIANCHLFILIIGGRFGGRYIVDTSKSITNAEYASARECGIPIFTFVKQDVLNDHNVWQSNKSKPFTREIHYPAIEKQEFATEIFDFIDSVRHAKNNNCLFGFKFARDIHGLLRKQWSAMFFEHLQSKAMSKQLSSTTEAVTKLTIASGKIEELLKGLYKSINNDDAEKKIESVDKKSKAMEFFTYMAQKLDDKEFLEPSGIALLNPLPDTWEKFICSNEFFIARSESTPFDELEKRIIYTIDNRIAIKFPQKPSKVEEFEYRFLTETYNALLSLPREEQLAIIKEYTFVMPKKPTTL